LKELIIITKIGLGKGIKKNMASKAFRTLNARSINTLKSILALNLATTFATLFVESQNKNTISMPEVENV
jgi:hypothetical protein